MLAQAITSTSTTAPNRIHSVSPILPTTCSCAGTSVTPQPVCVSGFSRAIVAATAAMSCRA